MSCFHELKEALDGIVVTDLKGAVLSVIEGLQCVVSRIASVGQSKVMLIGNGASASIASHMATDFWKNACIQAMTFNDSSLLTAVSNDLAYRHVFEKPIEFFGRREDVLIAISSSGQSENILLAVSAAQSLGVDVITLSGFRQDNPLRGMGRINFYVPSTSYGLVEVAHHAICHFVVDRLCAQKDADTEKKQVQHGIRGAQIEAVTQKQGFAKHTKDVSVTK